MKKLFFASILLMGFISAKAQVTIYSGGWPPFVEGKFVEMLNRKKYVKSLPPVQRDTFCNCVLKQIEKYYPKGMPETITKKVQDSITEICNKKINIKPLK